MKQEVVIRLKKINEHLFLTGKVVYQGRTYWITKSGKYFVDELPKGEEVFTFTFSMSAPLYRITWDDTEHPDPEQASKGRLARVMDETYRMIATLWQYHTQIEVLTSNDPEINHGKKSIRFTYEHLNKRHTHKLADLKKRNQVTNRILDLEESNTDGLVDVAYYFLPGVASKKHSEIVTALIEPTNGFLLQEPQMTNFLESYKSDNETIVRLTYIKKGIALTTPKDNFIENRKEAGYFVYGQYAGMNVNAVGDYLRGNVKVYETLQRDVRNGELIVEDRLTPKKMEQKNDDKLIEDQNTIEDLRKKAKAMGIRTWHNAGEVKLKAAIAEMEKLQSEHA